MAVARSRVVLGACALLLAIALWRAASGAWLCDDSFISLRYAQNLLAGHGLVYNPGEYVEGYTNLLWTLLLAGLSSLGLDPLDVAKYLGLVPYAGLALGLAHLSWRRARDGRHHFLPVAAAFVLVSHDFVVWASGGLETLLFTCLVFLGLAATRDRDVSPWQPLAAGALLALATLTRPDGLLFAAAGAVSYGIPFDRTRWREGLRSALLLATPVVLVLAVWIAFKLDYYGEIFPTAFYSKSVTQAYLSQGLLYVGLYLAKNWVLVAASALLVLARARRWGEPERSDDWENLFWLASAGGFVAYLIHVGGDFMFARRILPAVPLLLVVVEETLSRLQPERRRQQLAIALLLGAVLTLPLYGPGRARIRGIADEPLFYPPAVIEARQQQAEFVGSALSDTGARVAFEGGMCVFGYFSGLPYLVEMTGLTQYSLARLPLEERGMIGHEKRPSAAWLRENEIHFVVEQDFPGAVSARTEPRQDEVIFGRIARARIQLYDPKIMQPLRGRSDVSFVPIETVIERSKRRMQAGSLLQAEGILAELEEYYFRRAGAAGRSAEQDLRAIVERKRSRR